jgi:hypothetical protein
MRNLALVLCPLLCLVLVPACESEPQELEEVQLLAKSEIKRSAHVELSDTSERPCAWECEPCSAEQGCRQACTQVGDCGSSCAVVSQCIAGYGWDEGSCSCVAD